MGASPDEARRYWDTPVNGKVTVLPAPTLPGRADTPGAGLKIVLDGRNDVVRRSLVRHQIVQVALKRMDVALTLAEQRHAGDIDLVDIAGVIAFPQDGNAPVEAARRS